MANIRPNTREEQDAAYSPEALNKREGSHDDIPGYDRKSDGLDDHPVSAGVAEQEENPIRPATSEKYLDKFTGKRQADLKKKLGKSFLRKNGPLVAIGSGTLVGAGLIVLILPALLLFHVLANMFGTLDPSSTALTQVTKIMLMNKLGANDLTTGKCDPLLTIACRFKTPSNELLQELHDNGITALDANGDPLKIDPKVKWPERPSAYQVSSFATESGETLKIKPSELKGALEGNSAFRLSFNKVMKKISVREYSRFSPSFLKVMDKFGFNLRDKLNIKERVTAKGKALLSDILEKAVKAVAGESAVESAKALTEAVSKRVATTLTKIDRLSKGSGAVLAMAAQCMLNQVPSMLQKALVGVQALAAVNMASPVITSISAIKAGDGDPDTASALGTMFTETDSNGKSMLDSAGMQYALNGSKNTSSDPTYQTVTPAAFGDLGAALDVADKITNNPVSSGACALITNPITGAGIAAGISTAINLSGAADFGLSAALNLGVGFVFSVLLSATTRFISGAVGGFLSSGVGNLAQPVVNQMSQPGQTRGNVFGFGVGEMTTSAGANNFGNFLTTDQLQAYTQQTQEQQLADAELDRATLSPFDPSSPYTFMGSIVGQLSPYYSSFSSVSGGLSMLGSLLPVSFGSILNLSTAGATDSSSLYENACPTPTTNTDGKTLAANIFCQPVPGNLVPASWNPNDTLTSMESMQTDGSSEIDSTTGQATPPGNPIESTLKDTVNSVTTLFGSTPSYSDWLDTCSDPSNAADCTGSDTTTQTYSLYTAANNVSIMLDGDQSAAQTAAGTNNSSATSTDTSASTDSSTSSSNTATDSSSSSSTDTTTNSTTSTGTPTSFMTNSLVDDSLATTNSTSIGQTVAFLVSLVSPIHGLLRSYGATMFTPATTNQSILASLAGFTLWG